MNGSVSESAATDVRELQETAAEAEREALVACNALYIAVGARVADDVKAKVTAAFRANAEFVRACADEYQRLHEGVPNA